MSERGNLKDYYNKLYSEDKDKEWIDFQKASDGLTESHKFIVDSLKEKNFKAESIMDFGCGRGEFLHYFKDMPTKKGIDFSEVAIDFAKKTYKDIDFILGDETAVEGFYELVTSVGVIEHVDDPRRLFNALYGATKPGGLLYIVCPNHANVRGVVWQTLSLLFNVPMSLADKHVINYSDIKKWAGDSAEIEFESLSDDVSMGPGMVVDLKKRLTNALRDAKMDNSNVDKLLEWLENNRKFFLSGPKNGWHAVYIISKK